MLVQEITERFTVLRKADCARLLLWQTWTTVKVFLHIQFESAVWNPGISVCFKGRRKWIMGCLGNVLWFIFGGCISGLSWLLVGCLWCISIIGIPVGKQCFKLAGLSFFPFGKKVVYGGKTGSLLLNIIWMIFSGQILAIEFLLIGAFLCITIVGIPFGLQQFKLAKLALMPFGSHVE